MKQKDIMWKRIIALALAVMTVLIGIYVDEPETVQAANYSAIQLEVPYFGQKISSDCGISSMSMVEAYELGYGTMYYDAFYEKIIQYGIGADALALNHAYGGGRYTSIHDASETKRLEKIYAQLKSGKPVLIYRVGGSGGDHWSVITGYNGSTSKLEKSGFRVWNTARNRTELLEANLSSWLGNSKWEHTLVRATGAVKSITTNVSKLTLEDWYYPSNKKSGSGVASTGLLISPDKITYVNIGVKNTNGTVRFHHEARPNKKYYGLMQGDPEMKFSGCPAGTYIYYVYAEDSTGAVLSVEKNFKVSSDVTTLKKGTFTTTGSGGGSSSAPSPIPTYTSSFPLVDGATYKIVSALSGKTMEVSCGSTTNSRQINLWSYTGEPWMQWKAVRQADGYSFINAYTGKALDIKDASTSGSAKLTQYTYNGTAAQRFKLVDKGNGKYGMIAVCSELAVDVCGSDTANGAVLDQHAFHGGDNQLWIFELVDMEAPKIENVRVTDLDSTGYTVICEASDNIALSHVAFPTWTDYNGQDDLANVWPMDGDTSDNTFSFRVNIADHNNEGGGYTTHIYAYDKANNYSMTGICVTVNKEIPLTSFTINASNLNLYKGTTETLTVTSYVPGDTTSDKTAIWTSIDERIASVNASGVVTAHNAGTTTIVCTVAGVQQSCVVTVSEVAAGEWSGWTTTLSEDISGNTEKYQIEEKVQYRSSTKNTTISNQSSLDGWTYYGEYWGDWQTSTTELAGTGSREVQRIDTYVKTQYKYSHWHNHSEKRTSPVEYSGWVYEETDWMDVALSYQGESAAGGTIYKGTTEMGPCKWKTNWYNETTRDVYNTTWNYRDKVYQFYQWGAWSEWKDEAITVNDNLQIETQTVYRYRELMYPLKVEQFNYENERAVIGTEISISALASGGQPEYQYRFVAIEAGTEEIVIQEYSNNAECNWIPNKVGEYALHVYIKDGLNQEVTCSSTLYVVPQPIVITSQPVDMSLEWGQNGSFNIQADGKGLTYQWQRAAADTEDYIEITDENSGYNTNTLLVLADIPNKNVKYRCVITDSENQQVISDVVILDVIVPEIIIDEQPIDSTIEEGSVAYFDVKTSGAGLTYQWQYCMPGTEEWMDYISDVSDTDPAIMQIVASMEIDGTQFRCIITDCVGQQLISDVVTLTVTEKITVYTIEYILNGAINHEENVFAYCAGETVVLKDPVLEGKEFAGWYTIDGKQITSVSGGNVIVEAKWNDIVNLERMDGELWIAEIVGQEYTGKAIKPKVEVYDGQTLLQEKVDYTITYKNNIKANDASNEKTAPTVIVAGKGNYSSKEMATFVITQKNISDEDIGVADISLYCNGKVQKPAPVVKWNGKTLKKNTDYTVEYPSDVEGAYKNSGTYEIKIIGKNNFCGEKIVQMQITSSNIMSKATVTKIANQPYTGEAIEPELTVKHGQIFLTEGIDYTVTYKNNIELGTATAIIKGQGAYIGEKQVNFKIIGTAMSKVKVTGMPKSVVFTESAIEDITYLLQIKVKDEMITLIENEDFEVSFVKNTNVGTATVIFKGINGYTGTLKKTFKITAYDISKDVEGVVEVPESLSVYYMKGTTTVQPKVVCFGKTLTKGKDYTLKYSNNTKVSSANGKQPTVTITGKGNYKGKITLNFAIEKQNIARLTMTAADKVYQNKANKFTSAPVIKDLNGKKLVAGTDYDKTLLYTYTYNTELADGTSRLAGTPIAKTDILPAGTSVTVTATGKGNYTGEISCTYRIVKANISSATAKVAAQTYTGKAITLEKSDITLKMKNVVLENTDYEIVSYSNNIHKGTATVTIKGVGNYGGTKKIIFKIKAKAFCWWWRDEV